MAAGARQKNWRGDVERAGWAPTYRASANRARQDRKESIMNPTQVLDSAGATAPTRHRALRSVGAVLAGLVSTFVVTTAVDIVLHTLGVFPPMSERMADSLFVLALGYRIPVNVGGSYVTARLAPARPLRHALALGVVGTVIATVGAFAFGNMGPAWYSIANIVIALPCTWVGGKLVER